MTQLMFEITGVWLLAVLAGMPIFASMGLAAFAFVHLAGLSDSIVPQKMAQTMNSFPVIAAPLFILMGNILGAARITDRIVAFASALIGWVRGGYAHASILSSMIFAGMVGSAVDGEDVVQEAMAKAAEAFPAAGGIERPESWLFRIAHNAALDALRRRKRQAAVRSDIDLAGLADASAAAVSGR